MPDSSETAGPNSSPIRNRDGQPQNPTSTSGNPSLTGWDAFVNHISNHKIDFTIAITRAMTIIFTISYIYITGFLGKPQNRYKQALLVTAATSSLRLHVRMPPTSFHQLDRAYLTNMVKEDSFHYLIFSLLFVLNEPFSLALLPCCLYAFHNLAVYIVTILDKIGGYDQLKLDLSLMIARYQQGLLHTIALCEITLMPMILIGVFTGMSGIFMSIAYKGFLYLRYNSVRNAHFKSLVSQIYALGQSYASRYMTPTRSLW